MAMSAQTIDTITAILTIPAARRILDGAKDGKFGEREYQEIIDTYFRFRQMFEDTYYHKK